MLAENPLPCAGIIGWSPYALSIYMGPGDLITSPHTRVSSILPNEPVLNLPEGHMISKWLTELSVLPKLENFRLILTGEGMGNSQH